jgi:glycosyltransferase involved in cell wall biosynthesis
MSADERVAMETGVSAAIQPGALARHARKKILFVTNTREYGGAERHLLELIRRLRGPEVQISILCLESDFFTERLESNLEAEIINCQKTPACLRDWVDLFRDLQSDVVVFVYNWFWTLPWMAAVGAWRAGIPRRLSIQHLLTPRTPLPEDLVAQVNAWKSFRRRLARLRGRESRGRPSWMRELPLCVVASLSTPLELKLSAYLCDKTICVSRALRESLVKEFGFPQWKVKTIYNGVSISQFIPPQGHKSPVRERLGIGQDEFVLVCVARLGEQKGIDILLQTIAQVIRSGVVCKCVIVGDGPLKNELLDLARELGLTGHVFFEGFREDVRPYLQAGSAFILTSHMEGLPLSILEAMACGLPSIVTDVGGNAEIITHGIHGLIVPRGSVDAGAEAITYLATHPQERGKMAQMARTRVCEAFDIEKSMAEIRRLILT